jgi:hypothetical protein
MMPKKTERIGIAGLLMVAHRLAGVGRGEEAGCHNRNYAISQTSIGFFFTRE